MGIGDQIIGTGLAAGASALGKRVAFGDGKRIIWDHNSAGIFKGNPNIAPPGSERDKDLEWLPFHKGSRLYNRAGAGRWIWNHDFKVKPGQLFFEAHEDKYSEDRNLIIIEPNVPNKHCGPNKQWPLSRWRQLVDGLSCLGFKVRQLEYGRPQHAAPGISTGSFRHAAALIKSARLVILPEGGLHHAAAAVGCPAVVLFGGFTPPAVLGYDGHRNLTGGAEACGSFMPCSHCAGAMDKITVKDVLTACQELL